MARGRHLTPAATPVAVDLNQEALRQAGQAATDLVLAQQQIDARVRLVAEQLGYQLPAEVTDPDLIQRDIAMNMRRSVEACLEVGRALRVLKEACGHSDFLKRLEALRMDYGVAQKFIQAASKFSTSRTLIDATGSQSKLFELLVLDDEEIEELALTGQTGELALDDVATMSVKDLRKAVRERKADLDAKDQVIKAKNEQLDKLQEQVSRPFKPREGALAKCQEDQSLLEALQKASLALQATIGQLMVAVDSALQNSSETMQAAGRQALDLACQALAGAADEFGVAIDLESKLQPAWLDMGALDKLTKRNEEAAGKKAKA